MSAFVDDMFDDVKSVDHRSPSRKSSWSEMSADVMELVFSKLSESCVCRAASTCKRWYSVADDPNFLEFYAAQENSSGTFSFRVSGVKYSLTDKGGKFVIQSVEDRYNAPSVSCPEEGEVPCVEAPGGLNYAFTGRNQTTVHYKICVLDKKWRVTSPMPRKMHDPVVGVLVQNGESGAVDHKLVFAGGEAEFLEREDGDDLSVSIYSALNDSWEACEPLPLEFSGNTSSLCMGSVVHRKAFYAYDKYTGCVSQLDRESKRWSGVKLVRPPAEVDQMYIVSRCNRLYLVGIQESRERALCFKVWNVDEDTMQVGELVHTTIVLNARAAPLSVVMRRAARSLEPLARCLGLFLILFIYCFRLCHSVTTRTARLLRGLPKVIGSLVKLSEGSMDTLGSSASKTTKDT